jgi:single-strand DNA-binding protein
MFQQTIVVGNLGGDPEMRYLEDGTPVTTFSVATNRRWTDRETGEKREKTTWFRVTAWRRQAEVCNEYLAKGRQVMVVGEVSSSAWIDQEGEPRSSLELTARNVKFLGSTGNGGPPPLTDEELADKDEIPF